MPNQSERRLPVENFQGALPQIRRLTGLGTADFAEAVGLTIQTIEDLEAEKIRMSPAQYIAVAALADTCCAQDGQLLSKLKEILCDEDEKKFFRDGSLLKRWFENFIACRDDDDLYWDLVTLTHEYKIFLDALTLTAEDAVRFVRNLTAALRDADEKIILPLRSIEQLKAEADSRELQQAMKFIQSMQTADVVEIRGEYSDPDFRNTILKVFERYINEYNLCLVTADAELADDVLRLKNFDDGAEIFACYFDGDKLKFFDAPTVTTTSMERDDLTDDLSGWETI